MSYVSNIVQQFTVKHLYELFESKDFISVDQSSMSEQELASAIASIKAGIAPPTFGAMRDSTKREGYLKFKSVKAQQLVQAIMQQDADGMSQLARRKILTNVFFPVCVVDLNADNTEDAVLPLLNLHL